MPGKRIHRSKWCGMCIIVGVLIAGICVAAKFIAHTNNSKTQTSQTYSQHPTHRARFLASVENGSTPRLRWKSTNVNETLLVSYNAKSGKFCVTESNILNIQLTIQIDTRGIWKETINAVCLVFQDENQICKADIFPSGQLKRSLHIKHKIFAMPGFTFRVKVLDPTIIKWGKGTLDVIKSSSSYWELKSNITVTKS